MAGPPPPPPPGTRGPPPPPPPGHRMPPMAGAQPGPPAQQAPQVRQQYNSTRFVDLAPQRLDAKACKKALTRYAAFTIRKAVRDPKDKPTWAKADHIEERLSQGDIAKEVAKLNEAKGKVVTASDKKAALAHFQQGQVSSLIDEQNNKEPICDLEWTLAQIDRKEKTLKDGKKETTTMTVYLMRTVREGVDPMFVHQQMAKMEKDRMDAMIRPPPPPPQNPPGGGPPGREPQIVTVRDGGRPGKPGKVGRAGSMIGEHRRPRGRHIDDGSSISSGYDSESLSDTDTMSSATSYTRSSGSKGHGGRRYSHGRRQNRSYSRHREHHRYRIEDRPHSPRPHFGEVVDSGPPGLGFKGVSYVPDVPRTAPDHDPVAAAYQAGKADADAERNGLTEQERYPPPPSRPLIIERQPVIIQESREPTTLVPYNRRERPYEVRYTEAPLSPRYYDRRFDDRRHDERRYHERRYADERWADDMAYRPRDHDYTRMEREAEEYIDRPRRYSVFGRSTNPFGPTHLPRSYPRPPSEESIGW